MERDLRGMTIAGRYRIERLLARGGMGTTYVAVDERAFERRVVIKVPDALRSDDARARFVNEARQIIGLQHPHIVTALDVGTVDNDDTTPFITMAYMGGGDLGQRIAASGGVQSPEEVAGWLLYIAGALDFVHEHHVLHRDVKPGNILFDRAGPNAEPFLADFGIAKALEGEMMVHTHTGEHLGSPKYMPPETWFGTPGPAFDQYSLACVAYEALAGTLPHTADNALALAMEKNAKPARPLTDVAPHVPAAAAAALMRGLEKDPAQRFQSCSELARTFAAGLTAPSIPASRPTGTVVGVQEPLQRQAIGAVQTATVERPPLSDLQVRLPSARLQWIPILATAGAICAIVLAAAAGAVMDGFGIAYVIGIPICYATVSGAWATRSLRVATLRSLSLFVAAVLGVVLLGLIPYDARGGLDVVRLGPAKDPNRLPIALPIAVVLTGGAFVIGRIRNRSDRDSNALLAIQVPMLGLCLWLAGRLEPSHLRPAILCGVGLVAVALGVLFVAPRTPFLADLPIPAAPLNRRFVWFSVAATLLGLTAPLISPSRSVSGELFYAAGVMPLTIFGILQQRTRTALSASLRGAAYGCAVLIAALVGGTFGFLTYFLFGVAIFHVPEQYLRAGLIVFSALPSAVVALGTIYFRLRRTRMWHPMAPLAALHLSWIGSSALILPAVFGGVLGGLLSNGETTQRTPGYLLAASAAASICALVSARASARRAVATPAGPPVKVSV
jgi:serine/threonine-protein kinase